MSLPLIAMFVVALDMGNYVQTRMSLDQVAASVASSATQYQSIYNNDMTALFEFAQQMAGATSVSGSTGATIITGIKNPGSPNIDWQQKSPGGSSFVSSFGAKNSAPTNLPDSYAVPVNGSVIAVEVFATVKPWVLGQQFMGTIVGPMRAVALYQPRSSELPILIAANRP